MKRTEMVDVQIVGGGPAGLTAALYAARAGLTVRILDAGGGGGQLAEAARVENYPGVGEIFGPRLAARFLEDATAAGAVLEPAFVSGITRQGGGFAAAAEGRYYPSRSLILANGVAHRRLGVEGERELLGRGVSYCAVCDGRFYGGRSVAVIGGGDSALTEALYLAETAAVVHLLNRSSCFRGHLTLLARLRALPNVILHPQRQVLALEGEERLKALMLGNERGAFVERLAVDGVFVAIGREPRNAAFSALLALDEQGYVRAGEDCVTSVEGLFAAGDTRGKSLRQVVTAVADGAVAAEGARRYLSGLGDAAHFLSDYAYKK